MPNCQPPKPTAILEDNITNYLDLPSNKKGISLKVSNYDEKKIKPANINQYRLTTSNSIPQNGLLSKLLWNFKGVTFNKSEFSIGTLVLNIRYEHSESQNSNLFYPFNDQLDYALADYFAESETTKCNIDKFLSNLLMKPITKKLSYCNVDE